MLMKTCSKCKIEKPLEAYGNKTVGLYGKHETCKGCRKDYSKQYYKKNRNKYSQYRKNHYQRLKENPVEYDLTTIRRCNKCNKEKQIEDFYKKVTGKYGVDSQCKECHKAYNKWRRSNPDILKRINAQKREHYALNKEQIREKQNKYFKRPEVMKMVNRQKKEKYANDIQHRMSCLLRNRIWWVLKGKNKSASTKELLGCTVEHFISHLESLFTDGMSWDNQGKWQVDHIIPCASFDLSDPEEQKKCFHHTNLQPLWAEDNRSKYYYY